MTQVTSTMISNSSSVILLRVLETAAIDANLLIYGHTVPAIDADE